MAIKLGSNIASLNAQRRLGETGAALSTTYEKLSSGQRINRASDDAAGLAIADDLKAKGRIYTQAIRNGNDGISLLNIADSAIESLTSVVVRIRELSEQAANGTYSSKQRAALDAEAQQLSKEFTRITQTTSFNGIKLFDGSLASGVRLQLGIGTSESINASIGGAIGTGQFNNANRINLHTGESRDVELIDLNSDNILDLVTAGNDGSLSYLTVKLGASDGSFSNFTVYTANPTVNGFASIAFGDLNGDGKTDIVTGGYGGQINIRYGNGDGSFSNATIITAASSYTIQEVSLGDLNGDGTLDIVTAGYDFMSGYELNTIRLGNGNGSFNLSSIITSSNVVAVYSSELADINADGNLDLITSGIDIGQGKAIVRFGNGNGTFGSASAYTMNGLGALSIEIGDLNGDGILDLTTAGYGSDGGSVAIRLGSNNGSFGAVSIYTTETFLSWDVKLADLNNDGKLDIISAGGNSSYGSVSVRLGTGNGSFGSLSKYSTEAQSSRDVAYGDLNGDGVLDLVSTGYGQATASVLLSKTNEGLGALESFSLKNRTSALNTMSTMDKALNNLAKQRGSIGASQSRVNIAISNLQSARENFSAAESRIRDADVAGEAASLLRTQILQQAAASVLSQANAQPQLALQLLR